MEHGLKALADAIATPELVSVSLVVRARDVVLVKGIVEAHDGLAQVYARQGGELVLVAAADRDAELRQLAHDCAREFDGCVVERG